MWDNRCLNVQQEQDKYFENDEYYTIKCLLCNNQTLYGVVIDCNDENIHHFECVKCRGYYSVCLDCENPKSGKVKLAQLIEHHNFYDLKTDGENYKIVTTYI